MATNDLSPLKPSAWDERKARHLLNRAGFGVPRARVEHLSRLTPADAVDEFFDFEAGATGAEPPMFVLPPGTYRELRREIRDLPEEDRQKAYNDLRRRERAAIEGLKGWWLERMATSTRPLEEKMSLFWHGHFATSAQKIRSSYVNFHLNNLFRIHSLGNFKRLTTDVGKSPAMLRYLDNNRNVKGSPNENWARELMELFTMGQGNYTERDIKESARAFTGWNFDESGFNYHERQHDDEWKTFLGRSGFLEGWDIIDIIFQEPVTARFICEKLFAFFAYENPDPKVVDELAGTLRENHYEIRPVLRKLLLSRAFYSERAIGSQIKSPVQFALQLADDLGLDAPPYLAMADMAAGLGQNLFFPPNVAGWSGGRDWINSNTLLTRYNMPQRLVVASLTAPDSSMNMMDMDEMEPNPRRARRERFQSLVQELPETERRQMRRRMEAARNDEERRAIAENTVFVNAASEDWDVEEIFDGLRFSTARECIEGLESEFLSVQLSGEQRDVLVKALGASSPRARLARGELSRNEMTAALHLVFSLAEYQLC